MTHYFRRVWRSVHVSGEACREKGASEKRFGSVGDKSWENSKASALHARLRGWWGRLDRSIKSIQISQTFTPLHVARIDILCSVYVQFHQSTDLKARGAFCSRQIPPIVAS